MKQLMFTFAIVFLATAANSNAVAPDPVAKTIALAGGKVSLAVPDGWVSKEPKFAGIVDYEFTVPAVDGDKTDGRVTIGRAGGGIEANRRRWLRQYSQSDGSSTEDRAKQEKKTIADCTIHIIEISGSYHEPPFAGGGIKKNYRLLAALIDAGQLGAFYVKFNGPERIVAKNSKAFRAMIDGLKKK